jgi:hypothetical protein
MAEPLTTLARDFAAELQRILDEDLELAGEFFATADFPNDDRAALRRWVKEAVEEVLPESRCVNRFLKQELQVSEVMGYLRAPRGLR